MHRQGGGKLETNEVKKEKEKKRWVYLAMCTIDFNFMLI